MKQLYIILSVSFLMGIWSVKSQENTAKVKPDVKERPAPEDPAWLLLTNNQGESGPAPVDTGVTYEYNPRPDGLKDTVKGEDYDTSAPENIGKRLLDNDIPNPSWHTVVSWSVGCHQNKTVDVTFDLKKKYTVCRVDAQLMGDDGAGNASVITIPEFVQFSLSEDISDEKNWVIGGEEQIDPEDIPNWILSKLKAQPARYVRITMRPKRDKSLILREVRIWGTESAAK